jgi:hypothetical protein
MWSWSKSDRQWSLVFSGIIDLNCLYQCGQYQCENAVLSGYITTLKIKQKLDVSSEGPSWVPSN